MKARPERCEHTDAWMPEAVLFGGPLKEAVFSVVCMSCGWKGQVFLAEMLLDAPDTGGAA